MGFQKKKGIKRSEELAWEQWHAIQAFYDGFCHPFYSDNEIDARLHAASFYSLSIICHLTDESGDLRPPLDFSVLRCLFHLVIWLGWTCGLLLARSFYICEHLPWWVLWHIYMMYIHSPKKLWCIFSNQFTIALHFILD